MPCVARKENDERKVTFDGSEELGLTVNEDTRLDHTRFATKETEGLDWW